MQKAKWWCPRFSIRTLLFLPFMWSIGWWWVAWPEQTARRFIGSVKDSWSEVEEMGIHSDLSARARWLRRIAEDPGCKQVPYPRDLCDVITGRQSFGISFSIDTAFTVNKSVLIMQVTRGAVTTNEREICYKRQRQTARRI
jgi:hypothetical protein